MLGGWQLFDFLEFFVYKLFLSQGVWWVWVSSGGAPPEMNRHWLKNVPPP